MTPLVSSSLFHGWRVVAAAFIVAVFGWGFGFYGPPIYLHAVHEARGWTVALVSAAVTTHFICGALFVVALPGLHARFGVPAVTIVGTAALALGVLGWALAPQPWQLFAATVASGFGWAATGGAAINAMVSPWFARRRPSALAMAYNGASFGGIIFSPLWVTAIAALGFARAAALLGAVMVLTVGLLARRYFSRTPAAMGLPVDGGDAMAKRSVDPRPRAMPLPGRGLWRNLRFQTLAIGTALGLFAQIGLIAHLYSMLVPALGQQGAGLAMGLSTCCALLGRMLLIWFLPSDRRIAVAANYGLQVCGCAAFLLAGGGDVALLIAGVVLFGSGIGNATSLPPLIAQSDFAEQDVSRTVALVLALSQATYAFAPAAFGALREFLTVGGAENTAPFFVAAAIIQLAAAATYLAGRR